MEAEGDDNENPPKLSASRDNEQSQVDDSSTHSSPTHYESNTEYDASVDMSSKSKQKKKRARRTNYDEMPCGLDGCTKTFHSNWDLSRHRRIHTGERPFVCTWPQCKKEFVQKCALKRHEQTHLAEKHFVCDHPNCGKSFKLRVYLDVHKRGHIEPGETSRAASDVFQPMPQVMAHPLARAEQKEIIDKSMDDLRKQLVQEYVTHSSEMQECAQALDVAINLLRKVGENATANKFAGITAKHAFVI